MPKLANLHWQPQHVTDAILVGAEVETYCPIRTAIVFVPCSKAVATA